MGSSTNPMTCVKCQSPLSCLYGYGRAGCVESQRWYCPTCDATPRPAAPFRDVTTFPHDVPPGFAGALKKIPPAPTVAPGEATEVETLREEVEAYRRQETTLVEYVRGNGNGYPVAGFMAVVRDEIERLRRQLNDVQPKEAEAEAGERRICTYIVCASCGGHFWSDVEANARCTCGKIVCQSCSDTLAHDNHGNGQPHLVVPSLRAEVETLRALLKEALEYEWIKPCERDPSCDCFPRRVMNALRTGGDRMGG